MRVPGLLEPNHPQSLWPADMGGQTLWSRGHDRMEPTGVGDHVGRPGLGPGVGFPGAHTVWVGLPSGRASSGAAWHLPAVFEGQLGSAGPGGCTFVPLHSLILTHSLTHSLKHTLSDTRTLILKNSG